MTDQTLQRGVAAHNVGDIKEAERIYRSILQSSPNHPDANHNLGLIAASGNQAESALRLFKVALEANPSIEQFWVSYIDALVKSNQLKEAKRVAKKAKKKGFDANKLDVLLAQSKNIAVVRSPSQDQLTILLENFQSARYEEAEKLAGSLTQEFPMHQFSWKVLGAVFSLTGRHLEAVSANRQSVMLSPKDAEAHSNLGNSLKASGQLSDAAVSYREVIKIKPEVATGYLNLGITVKLSGQLEEAKSLFRQAIKLKPNYAQAHYNLGNILLNAKRLEEAEVAFRGAISSDPGYANAYNNLGTVLHDLGRVNEAESCLKKAMLLNPTSDEIHYNLGNVLRDAGKSKEAEASYHRALDLNPAYSRAYNNLGNLLIDFGRLPEAEANLRKVIELEPDSAVAHFNLGEIFRSMDRIEEAEVSLKQAISLMPSYIDAHTNLASILKKLERFEEAICHFDLADDPDSQAQSLECLYRLQRYEDFDDRLVKISKLPNTNLRIAAVSAFSAHQRGTLDPYNFCKNPLDFIFRSNISDYQCPAYNVIEMALAKSEKSQLEWESRTTKFGFQGPNNVFENPSETIDDLESIIRQAIGVYLNKFINESNTFISDWPRDNKLSGWYNRLIKNGHHTSHIHSRGWLSGVMYLKTIAPSESNEGAIEFSLHGYDLPISNNDYPEIIYKPRAGDIVLFPSSLFHRTIPFTSDSERITIAFDLVKI